MTPLQQKEYSSIFVPRFNEILSEPAGQFGKYFSFLDFSMVQISKNGQFYKYVVMGAKNILKSPRASNSKKIRALLYLKDVMLSRDQKLLTLVAERALPRLEVIASAESRDKQFITPGSDADERLLAKDLYILFLECLFMWSIEFATSNSDFKATWQRVKSVARPDNLHIGALRMYGLPHRPGVVEVVETIEHDPRGLPPQPVQVVVPNQVVQETVVTNTVPPPPPAPPMGFVTTTVETERVRRPVVFEDQPIFGGSQNFQRPSVPQGRSPDELRREAMRILIREDIDESQIRGLIRRYDDLPRDTRAAPEDLDFFRGLKEHFDGPLDREKFYPFLLDQVQHDDNLFNQVANIMQKYETRPFDHPERPPQSGFLRNEVESELRRKNTATFRRMPSEIDTLPPSSLPLDQNIYQSPRGDFRRNQNEYPPDQNIYQSPSGDFKRSQNNYPPDQNIYHSPNGDFKRSQNNYPPDQNIYQSSNGHLKRSQTSNPPDQNIYQSPNGSSQRNPSNYPPDQNIYQFPSEDFKRSQHNYPPDQNIYHSPNGDFKKNPAPVGYLEDQNIPFNSDVQRGRELEEQLLNRQANRENRTRELEEQLRSREAKTRNDFYTQQTQEMERAEELEGAIRERALRSRVTRLNKELEVAAKIEDMETELRLRQAKAREKNFKAAEEQRKQTEELEQEIRKREIRGREIARQQSLIDLERASSMEAELMRRQLQQRELDRFSSDNQQMKQALSAKEESIRKLMEREMLSRQEAEARVNAEFQKRKNLLATQASQIFDRYQESSNIMKNENQLLQRELANVERKKKELETRIQTLRKTPKGFNIDGSRIVRSHFKPSDNLIMDNSALRKILLQQTKAVDELNEKLQSLQGSLDPLSQATESVAVPVSSDKFIARSSLRKRFGTEVFDSQLTASTRKGFGGSSVFVDQIFSNIDQALNRKYKKAVF